MRKFRLIPSLLLKNSGFYKTTQFKNPKYVGDSINTLKLFNDKQVDEILILDIDATERKTGPQFDLIEELASECFIPLAYGGGIRDISDMEKLFALGIEKISLGYKAFENPKLIQEASRIFGSQSILVCADAKKNLWGDWVVAPHGKKTSTLLSKYLQNCVELGAGEIIIYDVDRDGTYKGLDRKLLQMMAQQVPVPVIGCGGAQSIEDMIETAGSTGLEAVAAGSLFVYYGQDKAVLINYPSESEVESIIQRVAK